MIDADHVSRLFLPAYNAVGDGLSALIIVCQPFGDSGGIDKGDERGVRNGLDVFRRVLCDGLRHKARVVDVRLALERAGACGDFGVVRSTLQNGEARRCE